MPVNAPMRPQATQAQTSVLKYQIAIGALALGLSGSLCADALEFSPSLPYVGADVYQRNLTMVQGYGSESFAKRMPQGNLYIGTWFNDYFGLEGGWTFTPNAKRVAYNDTIELGDPIPAGDFRVSKNTVTMKGLHLSVTSRIPLGESKVQFIGTAGITQYKLNAIVRTMAGSAGGVGVVLGPAAEDEQQRRFSKRHAIPCFGAGFAYPISENIGIRLLAKYEITSKFKNLPTQHANGDPSDAKLSLKNNMLLGGGFSFQF